MARTIRLWSSLLNEPVKANLVETFKAILIRKIYFFIIQCHSFLNLAQRISKIINLFLTEDTSHFVFLMFHVT